MVKLFNRIPLSNGQAAISDGTNAAGGFRTFHEHNQTDAIAVRLEPQQHEVVLPLPVFATGPYSPRETIEYELIRLLQGQAISAAHMVIHAGLEAYYGNAVDPNRTETLVKWYAGEKQAEADSAKRHVEELQKELDIKQAQVETLERVIRGFAGGKD